MSYKVNTFLCVKSSFLVSIYSGMRFSRNFPDLRVHSCGNARSGLIFFLGGYHKLCVFAGRL